MLCQLTEVFEQGVTMTTRHLALSFIIFALLTQPLLLFGQTSGDHGDWAGVKAMSVGQSLRVDTKSKKRFEGTLNNVSDTSITVLREGKTEIIDKSDVKKVSTVGKGSMGKSIAIGTGLGAGIGAAGAGGLLGATGGSDSTAAIFAIGIAIGAGIGAAVGAALGGHKHTLIYQSQ